MAELIEVTLEEAIQSIHTLLAQGNLPRAEKLARNLIKARPFAPGARNILALVLQRDFRPREAFECSMIAILLAPSEETLLVNGGNQAMYLGDMKRAIYFYERALFVSGRSARRFSLSIAVLLSGDYRRGFEAYENRLHPQELAGLKEVVGGRWWGGRPLFNRKIVLMTEQGVGDIIQFSRFAQTLSDNGAEVIVSCRPELARLVECVDGVSGTHLPAKLVPDDVDYIDLLVSIPCRLGLGLEDIGGIGRYITLPETGSETTTELKSSPRLRVGLCWAGSKEHIRDHWRSFPRGCFDVLEGIERVEFFNLQFGSPSEPEAGEAKLHLRDILPTGGDFLDTAYAIDRLDLVITTDTSIAHIAGALGKPVWVLLSYQPDWRWMLDGSTSPWYPSARLYRQHVPGDWHGLMRIVKQDLEKLAGET